MEHLDGKWTAEEIEEKVTNGDMGCEDVFYSADYVEKNYVKREEIKELKKHINETYEQIKKELGENNPVTEVVRLTLENSNLKRQKDTFEKRITRDDELINRLKKELGLSKQEKER